MVAVDDNTIVGMFEVSRTLSVVVIDRKMLQSVSINFTIAVEHLDKLKDTIEKFRTDEHFRVVLSDASQLDQSLGVEDNFPIGGDVRRRKKKKQFDYEAEDENISCPENNFRIYFFFAVLDTTIKPYQKDFSNLRLTNMGTISKDGLKNFCIELESKLSDENDENCKRDVIGLDLYNEIEIILNFIIKSRNLHT
nr:unnamed protein product [Callosobruchus chinensis]